MELFGKKRKKKNGTVSLNAETIIKVFEKPIYWHIRRMVVSHEDAQDVLQETFIRIFLSLDTIKNNEALKVWIFKIATNECIRHLKKKREQSLSDISESELLAERLETSEYINLEDAAGIRLQRAILTLSQQERIVFNLRYYNEMNYEDIQRITGYSINVLKVAYHHAKEKIKQELLN